MNIFEKYRNLNDNDKIVYKNVLGAFAVKGFALFVTLYTLPAYISFFNDSEVLGLWFTILSLLNWILNFDLGIGNGLRNHLSSSIASNNLEETKRYISSAYFSVGLIVGVFTLIVPFLLFNLDFNSLLNISNELVSEKALFITVVVVFVGVMLQFWMKLINSILYALQKSSLNNFLVLCTNILILLYVKFAPSSTNDINVVVMAFVHAIAVLIPIVYITIKVFSNELQYALPSLKFVSWINVKRVLSLGGFFFLIQIFYMIIMTTNEYLISTTTSNSDVIEYQAYYKLFSLGSTIFALTLTPIWSVITKAKAENNIIWIKKTYNRFFLLAGVFCIAEFILIVFTQFIMDFWLGKECLGAINYSSCIVFAIFGTSMIVCSLLSSIANGLSKLKVQSVCYGVGALIKIPFSIYLVDYFDSWLGVMVANILCLVIYCVAEPISLHFYFKKYL